MEAGGTPEIRNWVLSFGAGAEVLEPAALVPECVNPARELDGEGHLREGDSQLRDHERSEGERGVELDPEMTSGHDEAQPWSVVFRRRAARLVPSPPPCVRRDPERDRPRGV